MQKFVPSQGDRPGAEPVSRKQLVLEVQGKTKLHCELKRHLAPRTVGTIMRSLPLEGNVHMRGSGIAYIETAIDSGTEKSKTAFKKGDVAFLSSSGSMCFFVSDVAGKAMTPIGKMYGDIEKLKNIVPGDVIRLYEETV